MNPLKTMELGASARTTKRLALHKSRGARFYRYERAGTHKLRSSALAHPGGRRPQDRYPPVYAPTTRSVSRGVHEYKTMKGFEHVLELDDLWSESDPGGLRCCVC